jgi:hypothetical protein
MGIRENMNISISRSAFFEYLTKSNVAFRHIEIL